MRISRGSKSTSWGCVFEGLSKLSKRNIENFNTVGYELIINLPTGYWYNKFFKALN